MALTWSESEPPRIVEVSNSQLTLEALKKYNEDQIEKGKKAISGFAIWDPVLLNTLNERLNIYNEKRAAILRKAA